MIFGFAHTISMSLSWSLTVCGLYAVSPDGSYTEDHSTEHHLKSRSTDFDDDFDDEDPLPTIGTCKSLYPFEGTLMPPLKIRVVVRFGFVVLFRTYVSPGSNNREGASSAMYSSCTFGLKHFPDGKK